MLQIDESVLTNSAVELSYTGGISSSNITGSLRMNSQEYHPQVVINDYHGCNGCESNVNIENTIFKEAMDGAIFAKHYGSYSPMGVTINGATFLNNKANEGRGIVDIYGKRWGYRYVILKCVLVNF